MMMMNSEPTALVPGIALIAMAFADLPYVGDGCGAISAAGRWVNTSSCPNVSPKKTVEGAIFGVVGGTYRRPDLPRGVCIRVPHGR